METERIDVSLRNGEQRKRKDKKRVNDNEVIILNNKEVEKLGK